MKTIDAATNAGGAVFCDRCKLRPAVEATVIWHTVARTHDDVATYDETEPVVIYRCDECRDED